MPSDSLGWLLQSNCVRILSAEVHWIYAEALSDHPASLSPRGAELAKMPSVSFVLALSAQVGHGCVIWVLNPFNRGFI